MVRFCRLLERERFLCISHARWRFLEWDGALFFHFLSSFGKVKEKHGLTMFMTGITTY